MEIDKSEQNRISQEVPNTFSNNASTQDSTLKKLKKAIGEMNENRTVYYYVSKHTPIRNESGEQRVCLLEDPRAVLVHPDNLPDFNQRINEAGLIAKNVNELTMKEKAQRIQHIRESSRC